MKTILIIEKKKLIKGAIVSGIFSHRNTRATHNKHMLMQKYQSTALSGIY